VLPSVQDADGSVQATVSVDGIARLCRR